jgi:hypothetical protein
MITFKKTEVNLEPVLTKGEKRIVQFEFEGDENEIISITPGCSCTASVTWKGTNNKIVALFTETDSHNLNKSTHPTGIYNFSKNLTVFLKGGSEIYVIEGLNKKRIENKNTVRLTFKGQVKL